MLFVAIGPWLCFFFPNLLTVLKMNIMFLHLLEYFFVSWIKCGSQKKNNFSVVVWIIISWPAGNICRTCIGCFGGGFGGGGLYWNSWCPCLNQIYRGSSVIKKNVSIFQTSRSSFVCDNCTDSPCYMYMYVSEYCINFCVGRVARS